jgi:hypothetical protein
MNFPLGDMSLSCSLLLEYTSSRSNSEVAATRLRALRARWAKVKRAALWLNVLAHDPVTPSIQWSCLIISARLPTMVRSMPMEKWNLTMKIVTVKVSSIVTSKPLKSGSPDPMVMRGMREMETSRLKPGTPTFCRKKYINPVKRQKPKQKQGKKKYFGGELQNKTKASQ